VAGLGCAYFLVRCCLAYRNVMYIVDLCGALCEKTPQMHRKQTSFQTRLCQGRLLHKQDTQRHHFFCSRTPASKSATPGQKWKKWKLSDSDQCPCGETQTMSHIVESCPQTRLHGGLSKLHSADDDAVAWLTSYGS